MCRIFDYLHAVLQAFMKKVVSGLFRDLFQVWLYFLEQAGFLAERRGENPVL